MTIISSLAAWWHRWRADREQRLNRKYQRQEWCRTAHLAPFDPPRPPDRCPTCGRPGRNFVPQTLAAPPLTPPPKPRKI